MPTLYLIRGVPGSGKSTLAQTLRDNRIVDFINEADDYMLTEEDVYQFDPSILKYAHEHCSLNTKIQLIHGSSVAVSNTSTTEKEVQVYRDIALQAGANFVSIIVENRHEGKNVHDVPEDKIQQMKNRFSLKL